jgi:hypothetical protein
VRILYNNFDDLVWLDLFHALNKFYKTDKIVIIDNDKFIEGAKKIFHNTIFFDMDSCITGNFKINDNLNIVEHEIFEIHKDIAFDLLSRFCNDQACSFNKKEKEKLYKSTILFWYNFLKKEKINLCFSKLIPHHFYDYIIYLCCKILKIKFLFFTGTIVKHRFLLTSNIEDRSLKILYKNRNLKRSNKENTLDYKNFKNNITKNYVSSIPWYIDKHKFLKDDFNKYLIINFCKLILNFFRLSFVKKSSILMKKEKQSFNNSNYFYSKFDFDKYRIYSTIKKKNLFKFYNNISEIPDLKKKYIYFAAAYQPESSSSPSGGRFQDHLKTLSLINKNLPKGFLLYYKEHPTIFNPNLYSMGDIKRSRGYYEELKKLKKLRFVNLDYDSFKLMENSFCVATISGEIGFEALFKKKPTIVFSKTWYYKNSAIFYVNNGISFKKAIMNISKKNYNFIGINNFFKNFLRNSIKIATVANGAKLNQSNILKIHKFFTKNYITD